MGALPGAAALAAAADSKLLPALSFGASVPGCGGASVHSIFERAANLELSGPRLVVLLDAQCSNVPHGIRLPAHAWRELRPCLRVGDAVYLEPGMLRFACDDLTVDLSRATRWHVDLTKARIDWYNERVVRAFEAARVASQSAGGRATDPIAVLYSRRLSRVLPLLKIAIEQLRVAAAVEQLQRLLGLGPGLTPSGDDFIVGCLAGLAINTRNERERIRFLADIAGSLEISTTTLISRQHLSDACRLLFAQPLAELAVAIATGAADVLVRLNAALAVGAHSGADGVAGLLFGLQAWRCDQVARPLPNPPPLRKGESSLETWARTT
jgi:uncharacterized protein DUF2877